MIGHSGAANSVGSLSPRAASRVPQTRARVERVGVRGAFVRYGRARSTPHPALRGDSLRLGSPGVSIRAPVKRATDLSQEAERAGNVAIAEALGTECAGDIPEHAVYRREV